ncbi:MAG: permease [Phycisphaerae bacterium]|nr:permease [Phycisphaerae bacterium]
MSQKFTLGAWAGGEWKKLLLIVAVFLGCFYVPIASASFRNALIESVALVKWYAQEHVLLCLIPAFFIAGGVAVFVTHGSVMKYLGASANKFVAYSVASVSGAILAVCSCTVLPLFAGIYRMGAGLGPATAFLYSGPAINVLAIVLTAKVLGVEIGIARAVGAIVFSVIIGLLMHFIFRKAESAKAAAQMNIPTEAAPRSLWKTVLYFASMIGILVFANWSGSGDPGSGWAAVYSVKWWITTGFAAVLGVFLVLWFRMAWWKILVAAIPAAVAAVVFPSLPVVIFAIGIVGFSLMTSTDKGEAGEWFSSTWVFTKQILPPLLVGVLVAGFLLGRPGGEGIIPQDWIYRAVGGNSVQANFFASIAGAFMYFATLTEVPILKGLMDNGMGRGPALALLLAGPALSLPNMLVIRTVIGTKKTLVYISLVVVMATISGIIFGAIGL